MLFGRTRSSRRGIAQIWIIAGIAAAVGIGGYFLLKYLKNKNNPDQGAYPYQMQQGFQGNQGYQGYGQIPPGYAPKGPTTSERDPQLQDPELRRLWDAVQAAYQRLTVVMESKDQAKIAAAQAQLQAAQRALNAKKLSMR